MSFLARTNAKEPDVMKTLGGLVLFRAAQVALSPCPFAEPRGR